LIVANWMQLILTTKLQFEHLFMIDAQFRMSVNQIFAF